MQHPSLKIRHVLLLIGEQGTGKSFLIELIKALVGKQNIKVAESEELLSEWTASLANIQVLVVEELMTFERTGVYNRLKTWITEENVPVNEKFVQRHLARTPRIILAFSNHDAPIRIQEGDRRFHVIRSAAAPKEPEYYAKLFAKDGGGLSQAPAFLHFLLERDISHFNPSAPPPMTEAKKFIMERSRPTLIQELEIMMNEGAGPFWKDLIELQEVGNAMALRLYRKHPGSRALADALKEMGAVQLGQVRLYMNTRVRPWAWRNGERWLAASPDEVREEILRLPPVSIAS
jgi:hypothetical protein